MRNLYPVVVAAAFILTSSGAPAGAQFEFEKKLDFRPGGQTIGGPGILQLATNEVVYVSVAGGGPVCATVANVGSVELQFTLFSVDSISSPPLGPGRTHTLCGTAVGFIQIECLRTRSDQTCNALWRVDAR